MAETVNLMLYAFPTRDREERGGKEEGRTCPEKGTNQEEFHCTDSEVKEQERSRMSPMALAPLGRRWSHSVRKEFSRGIQVWG